MIPVVVSTYDKHRWMLPAFAHLFNKYWSPDVCVVVIGFKAPDAPLPPNFKFESMAPKETKAWSDHHRDWLLKKQYGEFVFLLDDYFLYKPIRKDIIDQLINAVKSGAAKGDINCDMANAINARHGFKPVPYRDGMVKSLEASKYRTTLQPCIWSRDFMLHLLKPGRNPWQFEINGNSETAGRLIVSNMKSREASAYPMCNMMYRGKLDVRAVEKMSLQDRSEIANLGFRDIFNKNGVKWTV